MSDGLRRGLLLVAVLIAIPVSAVNYGRRVDDVALGVNECLDGGDLCVGRYVGWGFGRVLTAERGDVVLTLPGGREITLVDWDDAPDVSPGFVVSVAGIYRGDGRLAVTRHQLHPRRWLKELVGIAGLIGWLAGFSLFALRRWRIGAD